MKRRLWLIVSLLVALHALAEVTLPRIEGHVVGYGGPIPGVTVLLTGPGIRYTRVTDSNGAFRFDAVPRGDYEIRAELEGFARTRRMVTVAVNDLTLELSLHAEVTEAITVTALSPTAHDPWTVLRQVSGTREQTHARYAHVEEHAYLDASKQRTTTFSIDVDRASYANVRGLLQSGYDVPPDAVRVEEMINYFTYDYPRPSDGIPFSITTEIAGCPWNPANRLLRIGVQGRALQEADMAPNQLVFLVDVSGSMDESNRLPLIQSALRLLVARLRAEDRVAIVVYAGEEGLALPSTSGADKSAILAAIDNLSAGGSTAGGAGIELAYKIAQQNLIPDGNNRVILATDGDFNVGPASASELEELIARKRKSGIFLSVVGVGEQNDAALETLADKATATTRISTH
ncbi:MAG: von Willebrand factor type A domain-containing protein [Acidobacteria bacterium]|nr:von Willebrand factor type A domain-containing protein [Acidobacteriota bacterium]MBV9475001.1 von Willebrand factor type A domain-containing protein [Acidobacteriota bacterium]